MYRIFRYLTVLVLCAVSALPALAATEVYDMPRKDGQHPVKTVEGELLFYDMGGSSGSTPGYFAGYTRFVPADESGQVQISFNTLDLTGSAAVYIYDGDITFTGYYSDIPEGYLAKLTGSEAGGTFVSTTGSLSVLYHCKGTGGGAGWEALVTEVPSKQQEWKEVSAVRTGLPVAYPGKQGQPLIKVNALTDGGAEPLSVSELAFTLGGTLPLDKLSNLRVVYSKSSDAPEGDAFGVTAAGASSLSFSGDVPLKHGDNYFWLLADIADDAAAGQTVEATLTGLTAGSTQRVASPIAPEGSVTLANMVLLSSTPKTWKVGDMPIDFYDDGGIGGKISADFTGQATFVPTTPGKKVRIRFTKLALFNTSSTGKNDVLKVYNGTAADDAQLLATVLKDLITVHSTAADGSLTVSLTSTTGVPADGFEAVVEEFTPQPMEIESIAASRPDTGNAAAGEQDVRILLFDVKTRNTEPALTLDSFDFASASTAPVSAARLYFLGSDATSAGTLVGSASAPGATFSIAADSPVTLAERDNWFLLCYNVGRDAVNDQTLTAALTAVVSGAIKTAATEGNPAGERKIENVYYSRTKHATYTVNGTWQFKTTPSQYSYYGYDNTEGEQITTFLPATEGMTMEIDFSKFNLASSNYGTPAVLKIIDGESADGAVLWEMTYSTRSEGPGRALRAGNAAGALTVVFNSNGNRGGSGQGFAATVREYRSHPMEITAVEAVQTNTDNIRPAATDQEIISVKVTADGDQNPVSVTELDIDMKGCQDIVKTVKIYSTGKDQTFATGALVAEEAVDPQSAVQKLTLANPLALNEKDNWLHVAYDMAETLPSDRKVDASVAGLTAGGKNIAVTAADPDGERMTKNIYYFEGGGKTVTVDGSMLFYDNMGPDAKYTTEAQGSVTFMPTEGKIIRFVFKNFYTNIRDYFYIYNGTDTQATPLQKLSGSKSDLAPVISTADNGALTVVFEPTKPYNDGWEIEVQAFEPQPLAVKQVSTEPVNDIKMLRGSENNKMLKVAVKIAGDKGLVDLTSFDFSALATDMAALRAARLWYTGESDVFGTYSQYGETLYADPLAFSGSQQYRQAGTYYYWLTYDVTPAASLDAQMQARLTSLTANGATVTPAEERDALVTVQEGMHGSFTVGTSGQEDYLSVSAAIEAMKGGIDGPVELLLSDGNYKELVKVPAISGSSAMNTITMRSASGKRENTVITYDVYTDPGSSHYADRYGVFTLDGVNHFTLRDVTVATEALNFPGVVYVRNQSRDNTVENCVIRSPRSNDQGKGTSNVYMYAKNEANCNSDRFTLKDCLVDGGLIGVNMGGTGYVALPQERGGHITGNTFVNQGSKGIYVHNEDDVIIEGNTVSSDGEGTTSSFWGIDVSLGHGPTVISDNVVRMTGPVSSAHGMYVRANDSNWLKEQTHRIYNNEINISGISSAVTGLRVNNDLPGVEITHNTFRLRGDNANSNGIYFSGTMAEGLFANNIVQNEAGGTVYGVNREAYLAELPMRGNVVWTSGEVFAYVSQNRTFDEWKAVATLDTDPALEQTQFLSDEILEPAEKGSLCNGSPVDYVTTDLNGSARDKEHPSAGAYEYGESTGALAMAEGMPAFRDITHESAIMQVASTMTGTLNYFVTDSDAEAPSADDITGEDLKLELRKGRTAEVKLTGLKPNKTYKVYSVLTSLRGVQSDVLTSEPFTTTYTPTAVATFEDAGIVNDVIYDGTFSFTGFTLEDITDGVGETPNAKAALMEDGYGVVKLTNSDDLSLDGFFIKNEAEVTLTTRDVSLREQKTKTVAASPAWTYVNLRDLGPMTYLDFESDGNVSIDNFAGQPLTLEVTVDFDETIRLTEGAETSVPASISGGVGPYAIEWRDAAGATVGTTATLSLKPAHSAAYTVSVSDAWNSKASAAFKVYVEGAQYAATFDDLQLEPESNWHGDTEDEDYMNGSFFSGSFEFNNLYMADWDSWAFFGYSNSTSTSFSDYYTDQYNSAVGHGHGDSANYGVLYASDFMGQSEATVTNSAAGQTVEGCWFTNSAWVVSAILNGDGMSDAFGKDDNLILHITGLDSKGETTGAVDFPLADYSADDEKDRWYLDSWQWCDLKPLGAVCKLRFNITGTKSSSLGLTTPTYVCLDDLGTGREVAEAETVTLLTNAETPSDSFALEPYFSFKADEGAVSYAIECEDSRVSLNDGTVTVEAPSGEQMSLVAHATQRGKHEYVRIPVKVDARPLGVETVETVKSVVYPNPARDYVRVSSEATDYTVTLISMDGRALISMSGCSGTVTMDLNGVSAGNYLVKVTSADGRAKVHKLLVK